MERFKVKDCGSICQLVLFLVVAVTGAATLIIGLTMNSKYGPQAQEQPLVIRLNSFSVSNLNLSNAMSLAIWDANLLFGNDHSNFHIRVERFESFVYYDNHEDDALSCALVEGIHLGPKEQKLVEIMFNASGCERGGGSDVERRVFWEIKRDIGDNGILQFGVGMNLPQVAYRRGPWSWVYELNPRCSDLDVMFVQDTGAGLMLGGKHKVCLVPPLK